LALLYAKAGEAAPLIQLGNLEECCKDFQGPARAWTKVCERLQVTKNKDFLKLQKLTE